MDVAAVVVVAVVGGQSSLQLDDLGAMIKFRVEETGVYYRYRPDRLWSTSGLPL
jgi:hypothetical protein